MLLTSLWVLISKAHTAEWNVGANSSKIFLPNSSYHVHQYLRILQCCRDDVNIWNYPHQLPPWRYCWSSPRPRMTASTPYRRHQTANSGWSSSPLLFSPTPHLKPSPCPYPWLPPGPALTSSHNTSSKHEEVLSPAALNYSAPPAKVCSQSNIKTTIHNSTNTTYAASFYLASPHIWQCGSG